MHAHYACRSVEHRLARRQFLGTLATGSSAVVGGLGVLASPASAEQLAKTQKRILVVNMHGGLSQLESWDPKPGAETGGPFRAIATSVPGIHISELLPLTAQQMHHMCLIRGVNTSEDDHGKGAYLMMTGRRKSPASDFPQIGAVAARALCPETSSLPGHIVITTGGGGGRGNDSAYLGPKYASIAMGNGNPPQYTQRPENITDQLDAARNDFRKKVNDRFLSRRRTAVTDAYTYSFEQAQQLMAQRDVFDVTKEPPADFERYGKHDFGRHCLLARRLMEKGVTFVQVSHSNYDSHHENFNFHIEQLGEFDRSFSNLLSDIAARGMLDSTLIVVLSEFGRTPGINQAYGRDHWSKAWSVALAGAGAKRGAVYGRTSANGTVVEDGQVDHGHLFHTYLQACGVDTTGSFDVDGRATPIADPAAHVIKDVLA